MIEDPRRFVARLGAVCFGLSLGLLAAVQFHSCQDQGQTRPDVPGPPPARADDDPAPPAGRPTDLFTEVQLTDDGPTVLRAYASTEGHTGMPPAGPGDWRNGPGRSERPQSLGAYKQSGPVRADEEYTTLVIQPLGPFDEEGKKTLALLKDYTAAFFGCPCEVRESIPLPTKMIRKRARGRIQHHTKTIMDDILIKKLPAHAIAYLGVTMSDLYPDPDWNYVFGQAYIFRRVGVYSFARHRAKFWGAETTDASRLVARRRAFQVLAHETGHMFGMLHCTYFACTMNGSNNLQESDGQPLWLCPVCASKLTWNRGFDPVTRYQALADFFAKVNLKPEADWYTAAARRVAALR